MKRAVQLLCLTLPFVVGCRPSTHGLARAAEPEAPFLRVIGSVQDGGVPHAACSGPTCRRARETGSHRLVASLALVLPSSEKVYFFEATPDVREQLEAVADVRGPLPNGVDRAPVDGLFLSHAHIGHYLGLAFFGYEAVHTRRLPVYSTPRMAAFLRSNGPWSQLVDKQNISIQEVPSGGRVELEDGVSVTLVPSPHREEYTDTVGFLIRGPERALLFVPDTDAWEHWSPSIEHWLGQVDVALLDGTFYSGAELPNRSLAEIGHPLVASSMDRFESLGEPAPEIAFIHMNHSNPILLDDTPERATLVKRGFKIAAEGMEFDL
ncbi:MAG: pyrroloquinoline quinone biosynthesis protein PqqB [bacterium]|nr:pyrroloquinoline quinone biosynthesis protein PqqB [bacterium]